MAPTVFQHRQFLGCDESRHDRYDRYFSFAPAYADSPEVENGEKQRRAARFGNMPHVAVCTSEPPAMHLGLDKRVDARHALFAMLCSSSARVIFNQTWLTGTCGGVIG